MADKNKKLKEICYDEEHCCGSAEHLHDDTKTEGVVITLAENKEW